MAEHYFYVSNPSYFLLILAAAPTFFPKNTQTTQLPYSFVFISHKCRTLFNEKRLKNHRNLTSTFPPRNHHCHTLQIALCDFSLLLKHLPLFVADCDIVISHIADCTFPIFLLRLIENHFALLQSHFTLFSLFHSYLPLQLPIAILRKCKSHHLPFSHNTYRSFHRCDNSAMSPITLQTSQDSPHCTFHFTPTIEQHFHYPFKLAILRLRH